MMAGSNKFKPHRKLIAPSTAAISQPITCATDLSNAGQSRCPSGSCARQSSAAPIRAGGIDLMGDVEAVCMVSLVCG
jgi:hypothetical protein